MKRQSSIRNTLAAAAVLAMAAALPAFAQATLPAETLPAALPPGHPSMDQLLTEPPAAIAGTQAIAGAPAAATGTLSIKLTPGSAGMTLAADEAVTVELFHRNAKIKQYDLHADKTFSVTLSDVPIMPPVQGVVTVKHNGLTQQIMTPELSPDAPAQSVEMKVFDATEAPPVWNVAMQHMILEWDAQDHSVRVTEMISTSTQGDRAWLGAKTAETAPADGAKGRVTLTIPLPPGVEEVELGDGFTEAGCRIEGGKLVTGDPLFPGRAEWRFSYVLPIEQGTAKLPIASPAAADNLIVFAPADGALIRADGLSGGDVVDAGDGKVRMYRRRAWRQERP